MKLRNIDNDLLIISIFIKNSNLIKIEINIFFFKKFFFFNIKINK